MTCDSAFYIMILRKENTNYKQQLKKPVFPMIILFIIIIIGTFGYEFLWRETDATLIDSLYMTIITITTIGFAEIYPLDTAGRIFTGFIAVFGIGSLFYILSVVMENLVMLQLSNYRGQKKIMKKLDNLNNHIIIVGMGRVGRLAAQEISNQNQNYVIIDNDISKNEYFKDLSKAIVIEGDATEDDVLIKAGIDRAKGMIVATANSATTVFVVISAKVLNPKIFIVARADAETSRIKLMRTGADRIVNPYSIGGQRLANLMINRNIVEFFETGIRSDQGSLNIESIQLPDNSTIVGQSIREIDFRNKAGVTILAIVRDTKPVVNPDADFRFEESDTLMVFGTRDHFKKLEEVISSKKK